MNLVIAILSLHERAVCLPIGEHSCLLLRIGAALDQAEQWGGVGMAWAEQWGGVGTPGEPQSVQILPAAECCLRVQDRTCGIFTGEEGAGTGERRGNGKQKGTASAWIVHGVFLSTQRQ